MLLDLQITISGLVQTSGLGVKLEKEELQTSERLMWITVMTVSNYETFKDCSTAIVS